MGWVQILGYIGSALMFSTFYMKTMIPLRVTGIAANCCMIVYTAIAGIYPVLILQSALLPLNVYRLIQMRRLIDRVKKAARGDFKLDSLIPFMRHEPARKGTTLFEVGDDADKLYLIQSGAVRLVQIDRLVGPGNLIGEIGILSPHSVRTATAVCAEDSDLYSITQDQVLQLYYQDPQFGFFLVRLVTARLLHNLEEAKFDAAATLAPKPAR